MHYTEALSYLYSFLNFERFSRYSYRRELNLERMKLLLRLFDHPEKSFKSVLIAGTKGKGSTAFFLFSILRANGIRTGLYTSPHLVDFRERFRLNDRWISKSEVAGILSQIKKKLAHKKETSLGAFTFFEISTLLALLFFKRAKIKWAVLEVGMGGRLDATNAVKQLLSIVTLIGHDHEEHLGRDIQQIASEKAAIFKKRIPFISQKQTKTALNVIRSIAKKTQSQGLISGIDFKTIVRKESLKGSFFDFRMKDLHFQNLEIALAGSYQIENAGTALAAAMTLKRQYGVPITENGIRCGLLLSDWNGRFQLIEKGGFTYILDGAHNLESMEALVRSIQKHFDKRSFATIFGISREKNCHAILPVLATISHTIVTTQAIQPRAQLTKIVTEEALPYFKNVLPSENIQEAIQLAKKTAKEKLILITGSLFLVGEAAQALKLTHAK